MAKVKGTRGQILQWPKAKGPQDKQYNDQRERDKRTNNIMSKDKGSRGQIIQWPKTKGQDDK
jgi:hypothetical protein